MKTRNNQQYKKKERMIIQSMTIPVDLVAKVLSHDQNFSRFVRDAIDMKIKYIEKKTKK